MDDIDSSPRIRTAVVTGQHPFDVPAFHAMFASCPDVAYYPQHMEDWACDVAGARRKYDVAVFYNFHQATPTGEGGWWDAPMRGALEWLGTTGQGILVLHHALLAFPGWQYWSDLVGITDRRFGYHIGEEVVVQVPDSAHPVTAGLGPWEMVDEAYSMADPDEPECVLLTTDHPRSMKTLAWTKRHGEARVLCLQLGHDACAFGHPSFRAFVGRAIRWCAGRI